MARSLKKGPFVDHHLRAKVDKAISEKVKNQLKHGQDVQRFYLNLLDLLLMFTTVNNILLFL